MRAKVGSNEIKLEQNLWEVQALDQIVEEVSGVKGRSGALLTQDRLIKIYNQGDRIIFESELLDTAAKKRAATKTFNKL